MKRLQILVGVGVCTWGAVQGAGPAQGHHRWTVGRGPGWGRDLCPCQERGQEEVSRNQQGLCTRKPAGAR